METCVLFVKFLVMFGGKEIRKMDRLPIKNGGNLIRSSEAFWEFNNLPKAVRCALKMMAFFEEIKITLENKAPGCKITLPMITIAETIEDAVLISTKGGGGQTLVSEDVYKEIHREDDLSGMFFGEVDIKDRFLRLYKVVWKKDQLPTP